MCKHQLVARKDLSNQRRLTFGDTVSNEIISATGKKQQLDGARDGASESQNCFYELLTCSSCCETVNKQDSVIESRLSDDM